jgi:hypothetical protein
MAITFHADVGDTLCISDRSLGCLVSDGRLQTIGHALCGLNQETGAVSRLVGGRTKAGKSRRLEPFTLNGLQWDVEKDTVDIFECLEISVHGLWLLGCNG